jgi:NAD-dependent deacetylase
MQRLVVFSGAGMSAESGLKTFRDSGGLWEKYDINEVATPEAWARNPELVLEFYNQRREQIISAEPNAAHKALVELESKYDVCIVTQNIDNLHERAGSKRVLHLHGEISKAKSERNDDVVVEKLGPIKIGDVAPDGHQLRPHVVWFGEPVPEYEKALKIISEADILIVVGTSLNVYPAAGLVHYVPEHCEVHLVDPNDAVRSRFNSVNHLKKPAVEGIPELIKIIL